MLCYSFIFVTHYFMTKHLSIFGNLTFSETSFDVLPSKYKLDAETKVIEIQGPEGVVPE